MANISDVAKRAGVSKATVSRYINNKVVSEQTALKIKSAIDELGFVPNKLAQSISNQKSDLIGIVVPDLLNPYFSEVVSRIEEMAAQDGMNCLIFASQNDFEIEVNSIKACEEFKVLGVILATCDNSHDVSVYSVPIVAIDRFLKSCPINIVVNNNRIGVFAANYLISENVTNVLFFECDVDVDTTIVRRQSFLETMEQANIPVTVVSSHSRTITKLYDDFNGIRNLDQYDGIYLANEMLALALRCLVRHETKIVTIDGTYLHKFILGDIKTIRQPIDKISEYAYIALKDYENNKKTYKLDISQ